MSPGTGLGLDLFDVSTHLRTQEREEIIPIIPAGFRPVLFRGRASRLARGILGIFVCFRELQSPSSMTQLR